MCLYTNGLTNHCSNNFLKVFKGVNFPVKHLEIR